MPKGRVITMCCETTRGTDVTVSKHIRLKLAMMKGSDRKRGERSQHTWGIGKFGYLFMSALEYHSEGAMTDQVFGVVLELSNAFHRLLNSSIKWLAQYNWRSRHGCNVEPRQLTSLIRIGKPMITITLITDNSRCSHRRLLRAQSQPLLLLLLNTPNNNKCSTDMMILMAKTPKETNNQHSIYTITYTLEYTPNYRVCLSSDPSNKELWACGDFMPYSDVVPVDWKTSVYYVPLDGLRSLFRYSNGYLN